MKSARIKGGKQAYSVAACKANHLSEADLQQSDDQKNRYTVNGA